MSEIPYIYWSFQISLKRNCCLRFPFMLIMKNGGGGDCILTSQVLRMVTEGTQQVCPLLLLIKVFSHSPGYNALWALSPRETCAA